MGGFDDGNGGTTGGWAPGPVPMPVWPAPAPMPAPKLPAVPAYTMPGIGRIVHYHGDGGAAAAIVTGNNSPYTSPSGPAHSVSLTVLDREGMHLVSAAPYSPEPKPGHWSWPPRA